MFSLAPFSKKTHGPKWFVREFSAKDVEHQEETHAIWKAYLTPTIISSKKGTNTSSDSYGIFGYQPNLVARQFGLIRTRPNSFFKTKEDIKRPTNDQQWRSSN